jgi:hypothetical protein
VTAGSNTPEYDRQKREMPTILCDAINSRYQTDVYVKQRMDPVPDPTRFKRGLKRRILDSILAQRGRCFVSGILLTIRNGWTLERLDKTKVRFNPDGTLPATSVLVCRICNVSATVDRTALPTYYLRQTMVPLPGVARARAQQELDDINADRPYLTKKK